MPEEVMLNQNQELEVETLDSGQLQAVLTSFINKQGEAVNLNPNQPNGNNKSPIMFKLYKNDQEIAFVLRGQKAKTLKCLIEQKDGCNALEIAKTFALRLSEYIRALRHDGLAGGYNLDIITKRENHIGGWHGKYQLTDQVEVLGGSND